MERDATLKCGHTVLKRGRNRQEMIVNDAVTLTVIETWPVCLFQKCLCGFIFGYESLKTQLWFGSIASTLR